MIAAASAGHGGGSWITNPGLTVFTWITFLILLGILYRYGWDPIVETLQNREEKIQNDLTTAEEEREKAEELRQKRQNELNEAHAEAQEIVENGREKGEEERERIIEEARDEADSMINEAENKIERERREAFEEVESEVGDLALTLTEKLLREELDEDDHRRIVDEFMDKVEDSEPVG